MPPPTPILAAMALTMVAAMINTPPARGDAPSPSSSSSSSLALPSPCQPQVSSTSGAVTSSWDFNPLDVSADSGKFVAQDGTFVNGVRRQQYTYTFRLSASRARIRPRSHPRVSHEGRTEPLSLT
jgi:hypothetical protein